MKKTRKSLLSVLLTLVMLVSLVPALATEAHAAPWSEELRIGDGAKIESEGPVTSDYITAGTVSVAYTNYKLVVTLSNATIDLGEWLDSAAINYNGGDDIVINLVGDNQIITYNDDAGGDTGIFSYRSSITITGTGTLSISSPGGNSVSTGDENQGIYLDESLRGAKSERSLADAKTLLTNTFMQTYRLVEGNNGSSLSQYAYITGGSGGGSTPTPAVNHGANKPKDTTGDNAINFGDYANHTINEDTGLSKISFNVTEQNETNYAGRRPISTYDYVIYDLNDAAGPIVTFAANTDTELTLDFAAEENGSPDKKCAALTLDLNNAATGVYVYVISQEYTKGQYNTGFRNEDAVSDGGNYYYTDYFLYLNVVGGKITQAVLLNDDGNKMDGFLNTFASRIDTYEVVLEKKSETGVTGTFNFSVKIDLPGGVSPAALNALIGTTPIDFNGQSSVITSVTVDVGKHVKITGLPVGTVVSVREVLDNTQNYKVSSKVENMGDSQNLTTGSENSGYTTHGTITGTGSRITYFNELADISLTGVSLRYAPYMAMMGAGLAVVGLSKTRRKEEEI